MELRESLLHSPLDFKHQMIELGSSSISLPSCHLIYGIIIKDGPSLGLGGTCPPHPPQILKKKILSMCVHKENFQFAPKYAILAPSLQKNYKLTHEIQKYMFNSIHFA